MIFAKFYGITSDTIFLAICLCRKLFNTIFEMCEELGAQRASKCPPQELEGRAHRALNF